MTHDPITFSITRFIAGLGIGGVLPVVTAQMAEFAPVKIRARLVTLVFAGYSVGGILVALIGKQLIEAYGWQSVFFAAILPVLLIPFILKTMPESMPFLIKKNRDAELRRIVKRLAPSYPLQEHEQFVVPAEDKAHDAPVRHLFHDGRGFSTVMIWVAFFIGLFMVYALSSWLTKLMAMAGYSLGSALNFVLVFNVGAMIGAVLGGWLGDKFNIKYVLVAFYAVGAISLTLMGYTKSTELLFLVVFVVGASTLGTQLLAYAYAGRVLSDRHPFDRRGLCLRDRAHGRDPGADPDRWSGLAEAAAGAELHGDRLGGPVGNDRGDVDQSRALRFGAPPRCNEGSEPADAAVAPAAWSAAHRLDTAVPAPAREAHRHHRQRRSTETVQCRSRTRSFIVTGSGSGLGAATARRLVGAGAQRAARRSEQRNRRRTGGRTRAECALPADRCGRRCQRRGSRCRLPQRASVLCTGWSTAPAWRRLKRSSAAKARTSWRASRARSRST